MLKDLLGRPGRVAMGTLAEVGRLSLTLSSMSSRLVASFFPGEKFRLRALIEQLHLSGLAAVPIVALIGVMMGLILAFNSAYTLEQMGAVQYTADLVAVSLTRELGPLITAIVVAGRSGSAIAAEVATMKIQEELDALKVMGISPVAYLLAPKLLAMLIALPILTAMADVVGILGGLICGVASLGIPTEVFISRTLEAVSMRDFGTGLVKAEVFGLIIVSVGAFCGMEVRGGAAGVGQATTRSVVLGIFLVIVADLIFTGLFYVLG